MTLELRYHVPRSQVWGGSRGRQTGNLHLHTLEELTIGRRHRLRGQALCSKKNGWYERPPVPTDEGICKECERIAAAAGLELEAGAAELSMPVRTYRINADGSLTPTGTEPA